MTEAQRGATDLRVALFATCFNDTMWPGTPRATVRLLERLRVRVEFPAAQTCRGHNIRPIGHKVPDGAVAGADNIRPIGHKVPDGAAAGADNIRPIGRKVAHGAAGGADKNRPIGRKVAHGMRAGRESLELVATNVTDSSTPTSPSSPTSTSTEAP